MGLGLRLAGYPWVCVLSVIAADVALAWVGLVLLGCWVVWDRAGWDVPPRPWETIGASSPIMIMVCRCCD